MPLINSEIELDLTWTEKCVISQVSRKFGEINPDVASVEYEVETATTRATF